MTPDHVTSINFPAKFTGETEWMYSSYGVNFRVNLAGKLNWCVSHMASNTPAKFSEKCVGTAKIVGLGLLVKKKKEHMML